MLVESLLQSELTVPWGNNVRGDQGRQLGEEMELAMAKLGAVQWVH